MLTKLCSDEDIITPFIYEPNKHIREETGARGPQNHSRAKALIDYSLRDIYHKLKYGYLPTHQWKEHDSAACIKGRLPEEVWKQYFKISIVRNPWDQAVSLYTWRKFQGFEYDFREFVNDHYVSLWNILSSKQGNLEMDCVIRFENLNEDFQQLMNHLGVNQTFTLPQAKSSIRKTADYRSHYTDELIEEVRVKNASLLNHFHYDF